MTTITQDAVSDLDRIKTGSAQASLPGRVDTRGCTRTFPVDVRETAEAFVLDADLPGVSREDLKIQVVEGQLRISGVRRMPGAYHYIRTFQLPRATLGSPVMARLRDGVLTVKVPKPDGMKSRRIPVNDDPCLVI